jgi:hypothetical protein
MKAGNTTLETLMEISMSGEQYFNSRQALLKSKMRSFDRKKKKREELT